MTTTSRPPAKKTEMIEVRVSHETKRDFLAACQREGRTASDVIREALGAYIAGDALTRFPEQAAPPTRPLLSLIPRPLRRKRYLAITAAAASLSVFAALPSAAQSHVSAACIRFLELDANHDGQLTLEEFGER